MRHINQNTKANLYEGKTASMERLARIGVTTLALLLMAAFLSACNSGSLSDGLESVQPQPTQSVGSDQTANNQPAQTTTQGQATLDPTAPADGTQGTQVAAVPTGNPVAFLPVSNAPQSAVSSLAKSIRDSASRNGLPIVASVQQGAQYQVKGYFSALEDGSGTLLVYVWDVLDRNNKRVYRINGQEQASSKSTDPWRSVSPQMLERVADSTVRQLQSWLSSR